MLYYIYARKSVATQRGESIQQQIQWAENYIKANFVEDNQKEIKIYKDEGFSGKNLDRPDFQRMYNDLEIEKPQYLLCYRLDRVSRSVNDFSNLIEYLTNRGINFISEQGRMKTNDSMGKAMLLLSSVFAQLERETIAERVRDNMLSLAEKGRWLGGTPPTGFTSEKVMNIALEGKTKMSCKLKPNNEELEIVKNMYDLYFEKRSISYVSKYLIKNNVTSRTGRHFTNIGIKEILRNPVYCVADRASFDYFIEADANVCIEEDKLDGIHGLLAYNKRNYTDNTATRNPQSEWIVSVGQHKGIITGEKWVTIQKCLDKNKGANCAPNAHNNYSLLSGLIRCKSCGRRMFASKRKSSSKLFDYICNSKLRGGSSLCNCQNLNGLKTDEIVCDFLRNEIQPDKSIVELLEAEKEKLKKSDRKYDINKFERIIKSYEKKIKNLINALAREGITQATFTNINEQVEEFTKKIEEIKAQQNEYEKELKSYQDEEFNIEVVLRSLEYFKNNFNELSLQDKRLIIHAVVEKIEWDGENLNIFIYGE